MRPTRLLLLTLGILCFLTSTVRAGDGAVEFDWGGHLKAYGRTLFPPSGTAFDAVGLGTNYDGFLEFRLNNKTFFGNSAYAEVQWEAVYSGGGTRKDGEKLKRLYPVLYPEGLSSPPNDDRRLLDLTAVPFEDRTSFAYHRLDRAMLAFQPDWGEIRLGRQAVTWGHGFTFNPMDLFNPFAPTDLERDYKTGDDLALFNVPLDGLDVEFIYVARRDPVTRDATFDQSSLGAKATFAMGDTTADIILTRHFEDYVTGIGAEGYLGNAAWRCDVTGTFLEKPSRGRSAYVSAVANVDYSWVWLSKNWYGYVELYYNGLSDADYTDHFSDIAISERVARGELYALGAWYLSAHVNLEFHPLLNFYLTPIVNLNDPSGAWLPRLVYDMADDLRLTLSGSFNWGAHNTEYGGYNIPGTGLSQEPADSVSAWVAWYF